VLVVNWASAFNREGAGGGVVVYQANLIRELHDRGHSIAELTTGSMYLLWRRRASILRLRTRTPVPVRTFALVNSPIPAPGFLVADRPLAIVKNLALADIFRRFLSDQRFDVIHFNNLEGLGLDWLEVAKQSGARVVVSLHNYFPVCAQVELWQHETRACDDDESGARCVGCVSRVPRAEVVRAYRLKTGPSLLQRLVEAVPLRRHVAHSPRRSAEALEIERSAAQHLIRRRVAIEALNQHADAIHAVSERTREIFVKYGLDRDKVVTSYIGTEFFAKTYEEPRRTSWSGSLRIAYLGYARRHKGFFYLLDALERLPQETAAKVHVSLFARGAAEHQRRLSGLRARMAGVDWLDGYRPEDLQGLLTPVHVGVVPSLWEDNLPQTAIEFVCHGVPIITTERGGAAEINPAASWVVDSGDAASLARFLEQLVRGERSLSDYWLSEPLLRSTSRHVDDIEQLYRG
jgi:glycosyltransferase involved in cell wall biosynthesis